MSMLIRLIRLLAGGLLFVPAFVIGFTVMSGGMFAGVLLWAFRYIAFGSEGAGSAWPEGVIGLAFDIILFPLLVVGVEI